MILSITYTKNCYTGRALSDEESHAVQKAYYLDYGKVLLIRLKFSIKNPSSLSKSNIRYKEIFVHVQCNIPYS